MRIKTVAAILGLVVLLVALLAITSSDGSGWRGRIIRAKLGGKLSHLTWMQTVVGLLPHSWTGRVDPIVKGNVTFKEVREGPCPVLWHTPFGDLWADWEHEEVLETLVWEQEERRLYQNEIVSVRTGAVVIDVGGHLGTFTGAALKEGAAKVVVFEPDPANIECFKRSFADEMEEGRVHLVEAAAWHEPGTLRFSSKENTVTSQVDAGGVLEVRATTIDLEVARLNLDRVDFLKMDIEGAERHALAGARETLARFAPSMAICVYHELDDRDIVPKVVLAARPDYSVSKTRDIHYFHDARRSSRHSRQQTAAAIR